MNDLHRAGSTIESFADGELCLTVLRDGFDYPDLYRRILSGDKDVKTLLHDDPEHYVFLVEEKGRYFVFKRFGELDGKFDTKLWLFCTGPFYSNLLRQVTAAIDRGCTVIPAVYLVAEKMVRNLSRDNYVLLEYVHGAPVLNEQVATHKDAIRKAFVDLHRSGLSLGNVKTGNLVLRPDGTVGIIDLSTRGTHWIGQAKDALKLRLLWGIDVPVRSRLAYAIVWMQFMATKARRSIKGLLGKDDIRNDWISKIPKRSSR